MGREMGSRVRKGRDPGRLVMQFQGKSFHKSLEILNRIDVRFPIDLIATRPEDVQRRYAEGDPLIREALDSGKVLYERDA